MVLNLKEKRKRQNFPLAQSKLCKLVSYIFYKLNECFLIYTQKIVQFHLDKITRHYIA